MCLRLGVLLGGALLKQFHLLRALALELIVAAAPRRSACETPVDDGIDGSVEQVAGIMA